jgi:hypothetical protein
MLVKLLATLAMAAATWLFWRLIARISAGPAKPVARPRRGEPESAITMIQDPETGAWRAEDRDG